MKYRSITTIALIWTGVVIALGVTLLAGFSLANATPAIAQIATATPAAPTQSPGAAAITRMVTVTGRGSVDGVPDNAIISLGVRTEGDEAGAVLTDNSQQMEALVASLRGAGVAQNDIRTLFVSLTPRYVPPPENRPSAPTVVDGFIAENMVQVTVRDLDNLGNLLDTAVAAGGNQISGISFDISDSDALLEEARSAAMANARAKAEQLADLAGAELGTVISINESSAQLGPLFTERTVLAQDASVPISPGSQEVSVDVQVTWELQTGAP